MEDQRGDRKQMKPSESVIHTYYQGDINTVVDEHFFRALNKTSMPKDLSTKNREQRRTPSPDFPTPSSWSPAWSKSGLSPSSGSLSHSAEPVQPQGVIMGPLSADPWGYLGRQGSTYEFPHVYRRPAAPPSDSSSFLHLLHMERSTGGVLITPATKPGLQQDWAAGTSQRERHGGKTHLDTGVPLAEKSKDLYWY